MAETGRKRASTAKPKQTKRSATSKTKTTARRTTKKATTARTTARRQQSSKTVSDIFSPSSFSAFSPMPMFSADTMMVPEAMRTIIEKTVVQTRNAYENAKGSVEDASIALEDSLELAGQNVQALNVKMIDVGQNQINSSFDLMKDVASACDIAEIIDLQTSFFRKQLEAMTVQAQEISELSMTLASDTVEPIKKHVSKSMTRFNVVG